jgi:hypothetical protein
MSIETTLMVDGEAYPMVENGSPCLCLAPPAAPEGG